jgi:hypothetical protein
VAWCAWNVARQVWGIPRHFNCDVHYVNLSRHIRNSPKPLLGYNDCSTRLYPAIYSLRYDFISLKNMTAFSSSTSYIPSLSPPYDRLGWTFLFYISINYINLSNLISSRFFVHDFCPFLVVFCYLCHRRYFSLLYIIWILLSFFSSVFRLSFRICSFLCPLSFTFIAPLLYPFLLLLFYFSISLFLSSLQVCMILYCYSL